MGVSDWEKKLIVFGYDGASTWFEGIPAGIHALDCVFWRFAHRLELALKDALSKTYFTTVDELLFRIYYLYEKSPKKFH